MNPDEIKAAILELCAEDHYGIWELYWKFQELSKTDCYNDQHFVEMLQELIRDKKIAVFEEDGSVPLPFDTKRVWDELSTIKAGKQVTGLSWFGLRK
jgi:hypothetical protein